jgi:magnesium transporter
MPKLIRRRSKKAGLAPGTLVHIGEEKIEETGITLINYNGELFKEEEVKAVEECFAFPDQTSVTWINLDGIHQLNIMASVGNHYNLHPLTTEDIVNTEQRPKMEDYEDYIFIVLKMLDYSQEADDFTVEQVSLVLKPNLVLSFQERKGDVFSPVRERIRSGKGKIRKEGSDYLAYTLMDAIVDHYFLILERLGERIETLQEELIDDPVRETLQDIHKLKREMLFLRRSVWPLRELVNNILRGESPIIQNPTLVYFRDIYDHTVQLIDTIETFREMLSGMMDIYLSSISNKTNEVMRVLTVIATIFMPLTFIAGVYGMNFKYMPELEWHWGYFGVMTMMAAAGVSMLLYFRRMKWL